MARYRRRRRHSGTGLGSTVCDVGASANRFGPRGALITGPLGFVFFYFIIPALLHTWGEASKASMTGPNAAMMGTFLDSIFLRRFERPSEWAGIAMLELCSALACWKAFTRHDLDTRQLREAGFWARTCARFLD